MNRVNPVKYAATGMVLMQASVVVSLLGIFLRVDFLAAGMALICIGNIRGSAALPGALVIYVLLLLVCGAIAFEYLSWFNAHIVFELKVIVLRLICWICLGAGVLIGLSYSQHVEWSGKPGQATVVAALIVASGLSTWFAVGSVVQAKGVRSSFDEKRPVALGFKSGSLWSSCSRT